MIPVELLILGSGTSQGVPAIGCTCETCTSNDVRDRRLRPSALFRAGGKQILIDTSSDFRQQMLTGSITRLDAVLLTHHHFDHIGGFDDLRQYNYLQRSPLRIYGLEETLEEIRVTFRYAFGKSMQRGGGVPEVVLHSIVPGEVFEIEGIPVLPVPVSHGRLQVLSYRIGNIAYVTDTNSISAESMKMFQDLDILVLDALRHEAHPTHFTLAESIEAAGNIRAKETWFTHIAHNILHERDSTLLPENMYFSYDGLLLKSTTEYHDQGSSIRS